MLARSSSSHHQRFSVDVAAAQGTDPGEKAFRSHARLFIHLMLRVPPIQHANRPACEWLAWARYDEIASRNKIIHAPLLFGTHTCIHTHAHAHAHTQRTLGIEAPGCPFPCCTVFVMGKPPSCPFLPVMSSTIHTHTHALVSFLPPSPARCDAAT